MGKYDKYSVSGPGPGEGDGTGKMIGHFDGATFEGSHEYSCHWAYEKPRSKNLPGWKEWDQVIHGPHVHKYPEVIFHLGTDPKNPMDLGAEVVMHMGPEMEEYVITQSSLVYIPANFIHGWWYIKKVTRPFIIFEINQNGIHTEKSYPELVPEEVRKRLMWVDQGYISPERIMHWPEINGQKMAASLKEKPQTRKYAKYFFSGPGPGEGEGTGKCIAHIDGDIFEGANEYWAHWCFEKPRNVPGWKEWDDVTHSPHVHKYPEVVAMLGTDPDDPMDLGADIDGYLGPDMEKSPVTRSTLTFMPANFVHGPSTVKKVTRPFIFIEMNQSPKHTQKGLKELVPDQKERDRMMFIDAGYDSAEKRILWPKGVGPRFGEGGR
jgi:hypothetical protein